MPSTSTIRTRQRQTEKTNRSWGSPNFRIDVCGDVHHETPMPEAKGTKEPWYLGIEKSAVAHGHYNRIAFAVQETIAHAEKNRSIENIVRWYGCTSTEDTVKSPEHPPQHLNTRYWRRVRQHFPAAETSWSDSFFSRHWCENKSKYGSRFCQN